MLCTQLSQEPLHFRVCINLVVLVSSSSLGLEPAQLLSAAVSITSCRSTSLKAAPGSLCIFTPCIVVLNYAWRFNQLFLS